MYILLLLLWLILNGKITGEILIIGILLTLVLGVLLYSLVGYTPKKDLRMLKCLPLFFVYIFLLFWEIMKANFTVIRIILFRSVKIDPVLVTFQPPLKTGFGRFLLANSITLTPGTITIRAEEDTLTVHCLRRDLLDTSDQWILMRWIQKMEAVK